MNQFKEAKKAFNKAKKLRSSKDIDGKKNTYSNLSKLYFRWAQDIARKEPDSKMVVKKLELSDTYLHKYKDLLPYSSIQSINDDYIIKSREKILEIAKIRLEGHLESSLSTLEKCFEYLEKIVVELEKDPAASVKLILSIKHNLAVISALQMNFQDSYKRLDYCINAVKKIYFDIDFENLSNIHKPAILDLYHNLEAVEKNNLNFNPYDFLLQF